MTVSQNKAPGSAIDQAASMNFSQMSRALTTFVTFASSTLASTGHRSVYSVLFLIAFIKSSRHRIEMFAPVTFFKLRLMSINVSSSGERQSIVIINAPRLPPCATSLVELENRSIKTPIPSVVFAALVVG